MRCRKLKVERICGIWAFGRVVTFDKTKQSISYSCVLNSNTYMEQPECIDISLCYIPNLKKRENLDHVGLSSLSPESKGFLCLSPCWVSIHFASWTFCLTRVIRQNLCLSVFFFILSHVFLKDFKCYAIYLDALGSLCSSVYLLLV